MSMNVSLTPELEKYIQKQVASQRYQTASEVVRQAIRMMQTAEDYEKARLEALRQDIQVGLDQLDRGEYVEIRDEKDQQALLQRITREGRARLTAKHTRRSA
jgi:antitoxin ParD1/3/4